ncbi:Protein of unknown function [Bacillus wiedmannii]|nr:Protein of unknown function [Bacillus wiedmannii]
MTALGRLAHNYDTILNSMYFEAIPKNMEQMILVM